MFYQSTTALLARKIDEISSILESAISATLAVVVHIVIGYAIIGYSTNDATSLPQSIRVSFVAPSSHAKNQKILEKTNTSQPISMEKTNDDKKMDNRETSGRTKQDATAETAAIVEPVFNAAYLNNPVPSYPSSARRDGIQGRVLLLVSVSPEGTATRVTISKSSGYSILDNAAKDTVSVWKFIPAKQRGSAIAANVVVPIEFKLN
jgi:protein TonB